MRLLRLGGGGVRRRRCGSQRRRGGRSPAHRRGTGVVTAGAVTRPLPVTLRRDRAASRDVERAACARSSRSWFHHAARTSRSAAPLLSCAASRARGGIRPRRRRSVALVARRRTQPNCGVWACFLVSRGVETACNSSSCSGTPFAGEAVFVAPTFPQDLASCLRAWRGRSVDTESPCRPRLVSSPTLGAPYGLPRPLRVCYGLSAAIGGTGSRRGIRRATRVQLGIHQLASPSSRIRAGTSSARMTVASRMIPAARPIASGLTS